MGYISGQVIPVNAMTAAESWEHRWGQTQAKASGMPSSVVTGLCKARALGPEDEQGPKQLCGAYGPRAFQWLRVAAGACERGSRTVVKTGNVMGIRCLLWVSQVGLRGQVGW